MKKVSIICISYNHEAFVEEALNSVFAQTYEHLEVIVLDDASKDATPELLQNQLGEKGLKPIFHKVNQGYTKTFNEGLAMASGDFIVDFALDDVMLPNFIEESLKAFEDDKVGVVFSNADYINADSKVIANHTQQLISKGMIKSVPQGDIFEWVLKRYFICTPTMVIKREVFDRMGGYDETLAYEDFDFWVRSSRYWSYAYIDKVMFEKRKLINSMSSQRYLHHQNELMSSVYQVCVKAFQFCKNKAEFNALQGRLNYEYRQCVKHNAEDLADQYVDLLGLTGKRLSLKSRLYRWYQRKFRVIR